MVLFELARCSRVINFHHKSLLRLLRAFHIYFINVRILQNVFYLCALPSNYFSSISSAE